MNIQDLKNKKIAILWYGKEGKSTLRFLQQIWCSDITILDKNPETSTTENIALQKWENYLSNLWSFDIIFKSPWVCPYNEELKAYKDKFISQTQVFYENYKGKVIAVTGTKWKSTTSTLIYLTLKEAGFNVKLVGNIWSPVLDEINILWDENYDFVIYEMSSYMLEWFIPHTYISVFNNIYNCHLDWHRGFENYKNAKINILRNTENALINFEFKEYAKDTQKIFKTEQFKEDKFELKGAYKDVSGWDENDVWQKNEKIFNIFFFWIDGDFSYKNKAFFIWEEKILDDSGILLMWEHNRKNISAVLWVVFIATQNKELTLQSLQKVITTFNGLPHRMEDIGTYKGITFINDAIATTPESTIAAIQTFSPLIWTIFIGGFDSGFVYDELEKVLESSNIENIVLFPDTWYKIFENDIINKEEEKEFTLERAGKAFHILKTRDMENAVKFAYTHTKPWYKALLSCASQSFSLWKSYEVKGNLFKELVLKYSN